MLDRVSPGRGRGDHGYHQRLVEAQAGHRLVKIKACRARDAVNAVAEIDNIEVHFQDTVFPQPALQHKRNQQLRRLPDIAVVKAEIQILRQLLGDRAGPGDDTSRFAVFVPHVADHLETVSGMVVEGFILQVHQQIDQTFGNPGKRDKIRLR